MVNIGRGRIGILKEKLQDILPKKKKWKARKLSELFNPMVGFGCSRPPINSACAA